ncbi:MAG: hypothetical protein M9905_04845 [Rhizobiaceae bacterium]|nr:hypothetical protein [Rhizobiaceae bacterium]
MVGGTRPQSRLHIADLAAFHNVTESWVTRSLRLAFLDPAIVEQVLAGGAFRPT